MIRRTPQEIADFFQCYVSQNFSGDWFVHMDKPVMHKGAWISHDGIGFPNQLVESPDNHDWEILYEPQPYSVEAPIPDNNGSSYSRESAIPDNKPDHASEVFIHKEYVVAEGNRTQDLSRKVNILLNHGWKLQGGVAVEYLPESDGYKEGSEIFYQAMVRGL